MHTPQPNMPTGTFHARLGFLLNEASAEHDKTAKAVQRGLMAVIAVSCLNLILSTVPELASTKPVFHLVEAVVMILFTAEYLARLWCWRLLHNGASGPAAFLLYVCSPYLLIDLAVLIPFYAALFTDAGADWLVILRILRLIRISRSMDANNILWAACKNKAGEIRVAASLFLFLIALLSMFLYAVENPAQPENFSSFFSALAWSCAKLIQGIGGYAEFTPTTLPGQILATLCGISFIAVFAIPAGLVASGFMDEIAERKKRKGEETIRATLHAAFMAENLSAHIRAKEKYRISGPRQGLTLNDVIYRLFIPHDDLIAAVRNGEGFQIKNYRWEGVERIAILRFEENCPYGTFLDRGSPISIISTHSGDQAFMGHFTARLADALNANYLSSEKYFDGSLLPEFRLQLRERVSYPDNAPDESPIAELFKADLAKIVRPSSLAVYILAAASNKEQALHVLNGGSVGTVGFVRDNATCGCVDAVEAMLAGLRIKAEKELAFQVATHEAYGNERTDSLGHYLHRYLGADALCIHVSAKIFSSGNPDLYYGTIRLVADALADLQARREKA